MIVLADNDIVLKLAWCDLFSEVLETFGVTCSDIRILNTGRHVLARRGRKKLDEDGYARLICFLRSVTDLDVAPEPEDMVALAEQPRIDSGEAVLFSVCAQLPDAFLATGDKRSLTSLCEATTTNTVCSSLCDRLTGKIVCFELIMERILDKFGYTAVRDRLVRGRECDGGLALWLGSGLDANEPTFRQGLTSFRNDLQGTTGTLLLH